MEGLGIFIYMENNEQQQNLVFDIINLFQNKQLVTAQKPVALGSFLP